MKDIAVPHGTPARHLIQINRLNTAWRPKKGQCEETFVPADCAKKRDTVMLLFPATSFNFAPPPVPTTHNSLLFTPLPWQILTSIIASNDLTKGSNSRGNPELLACTVWINTDETTVYAVPKKIPNKRSIPKFQTYGRSFI